jgi:hypothetical protein
MRECLPSAKTVVDGVAPHAETPGDVGDGHAVCLVLVDLLDEGLQFLNR